jgi:hypothetical protein
VSRSELEGLGAADKLPGVDLRFGDPVRGASGQHVGRSGRVVALLSIDPVPLHLIEEIEGTSFNAKRSDLERV